MFNFYRSANNSMPANQLITDVLCPNFHLFVRKVLPVIHNYPPMCWRVYMYSDVVVLCNHWAEFYDLGKKQVLNVLYQICVFSTHEPKAHVH